MFGKPLNQMDEHELKSVLAESNSTIDRFKATISTYGTAVRLSQRVKAELRDRFAYDATTGRRIKRRAQLL